LSFEFSHSLSKDLFGLFFSIGNDELYLVSIVEAAVASLP